MSYVASDPELHVRYVISTQQREAELAALVAEARGSRTQPSPIARLRQALGGLLIDLGNAVAPPRQRPGRAFSSLEVRRARTGIC